MKDRYLVANQVSELSKAVDESGVVWFRVSKYGDFPNMGYDPAKRKSFATVQRFDRASAVKLKEGFDGALNAVMHLGRGLPIYEGHADDPQLITKPGHSPRAVGRLKELDVREDGLWGRAVMNNEGIGLIKGEGAPYSATSPFWWTVDAGKSVGSSRVTIPVKLESIALTNRPNIEDNFIGMNQRSGEAEDNNKQTTNDMDPKMIREKLGLPEDASDDAVMAKITALVTEVASLKKEKGMTETKLTEVNSANDKLVIELKDFKKESVTAVLNSAVDAGKITEAQKPHWLGVLNADLANGKAILEGMGKSAELNTEDHLAGKVNKKDGAGSRPELNTAMKDHAEKHGLDLSKEADYDKAFDAVREEVYAAQ